MNIIANKKLPYHSREQGCQEMLVSTRFQSNPGAMWKKINQPQDFIWIDLIIDLEKLHIFMEVIW